MLDPQRKTGFINHSGDGCSGRGLLFHLHLVTVSEKWPRCRVEKEVKLGASFEKDSCVVKIVRARIAVPGLLALICLVFSGPDLHSTPPAPRNRFLTEVQSRHQNLQQKYFADLNQLAQKAQALSLHELAEEIGTLQQNDLFEETKYTRPPKNVAAPIPLMLPEHERALRQQLQAVQLDYAKGLYNQAQLALNHNLASTTYRILLEILTVCPDYADARRILGYELYKQTWVTPYERKMLEDGYVDDPTFGWLPKDDVERYHNGERRFSSGITGFGSKGRWIAKDREAEVRRDFRNAWEIRTANFIVRTNHSQEKGVEIARALEDFHEYFRFLFAGFYTTPQQSQALFRGGSGRTLPDSKRYVVHYYASKDEYVRTLISRIPMIAETNGLYMQEDQIAYFFHNPEETSLAPLYHEATHQLFYESQETRTKPRNPGNLSHFWIIEGIACYMESFDRSPDGSSFVTGNPSYIRFVNARQNLLHKNVFLPLQHLDSMGQLAYQQPPILALQQRYSESTGFAHFFMHYNNGEFRDALINHISQLYSSHPRVSQNPDSLSRLTDVSYSELDQLYRNYCTEIDQQIALEAPEETAVLP